MELERVKPAVLLLLAVLPYFVSALMEPAPGATAYVSEAPTGNSTALLKASTVSLAVSPLDASTAWCNLHSCL
jgi:hypothetical protein